MPSYFQRHPTPHAKSFIWFRWIKEQWLAPSTASRLLNSSSLSSSCLHQETPTPALFSSHPPFNNVPDLRPQTCLLHPILPPPFHLLPSLPLSSLCDLSHLPSCLLLPSHYLLVSMRPPLSSALQQQDHSPRDFPTLAPRCNKYKRPLPKLFLSRKWVDLYSLTLPESVRLCDGCIKFFYHSTMGI